MFTFDCDDSCAAKLLAGISIYKNHWKFTSRAKCVERKSIDPYLGLDSYVAVECTNLNQKSGFGGSDLSRGSENLN